MAVIEPIRRDIERPGQIKRNSAPLRLWHWLSAIVITGLLLTVLINSTITDQNGTSNLVKTELQKAGAAVTTDQARSVSHALSDSVWAIHTYLGYGLAGLLLFRLILEFFQLADQKFMRKLSKAWVDFNAVKRAREATHELTVKIIYAIFYILLIVQSVTGLSLAFEEIAFLKPYRHSIRSVHGFIMYLIIAFIIVHLAGVFLAERKEGKGIVSDMINGGRED